MRTIIKWIKENLTLFDFYWMGTAAFIFLVGVLFVVLSTIKDLSEYRMKKDDFKVLENTVAVSKAEEKIIEEQLQQLKEDEVLLIQTYKNEKATIITIPADSLQYYADSLYNR